MRKARTAVPIESRTFHGLISDLADMTRTLRTLLDPYRPELHYMRGPGPKWHAKHAPAAPQAIPADGMLRARA